MCVNRGSVLVCGSEYSFDKTRTILVAARGLRKKDQRNSEVREGSAQYRRGEYKKATAMKLKPEPRSSLNCAYRLIILQLTVCKSCVRMIVGSDYNYRSHEMICR